MRGRTIFAAFLLIAVPAARATVEASRSETPLFTPFFWRVARADVVVRGHLELPDDGSPSLQVTAVYKGRLDRRAFLYPSWLPPFPQQHDTCDVRSGGDVCLFLQRTTIGGQPRYHVETRTGNQGFIPLDGGVSTWFVGLWELTHSDVRELSRHEFLERLVDVCEESSTFEGLRRRYRDLAPEDQDLESLALRCIGRLRTPRALEFLAQGLDIIDLESDDLVLGDRQVATARALLACGTASALTVLDGFWRKTIDLDPQARDAWRMEVLASFAHEEALDVDVGIQLLDAWLTLASREEERTVLQRCRAHLVERLARERVERSEEIAFVDGVLRVRR
ncbi:MAG: hypothetical protein H6834_17795 [Planctomycetes bacterium]|nr:hypothetical protein [Planctomycetota bacterium]